MRKPRFKPDHNKYKVGELVVWLDVIDGRNDEVGIVTKILNDNSDPKGFPLIVVLMSYGEDVITGWDAEFVLVPHEDYIKNKEKIRKRLDNPEERVTLMTRIIT